MYRSVAHNLLKRFEDKVSSVTKKASKRVKSRYNSFNRFTSSKKSSLTAWLSSEGAEYLGYLKPYAAYVFIYGLVLNYALYVLTTHSFPSFNMYTIPAYGIVYYFLKEETTEYIVMIVKEIQGRV